MIGSKRVVWTLGVLSLALLLSACGDQVPATVSMPEPAALGPTDPGLPSATAVEVAETVATTSTTAPDTEQEEQGLLLTPPQPPITSAPGSALSRLPEELLETILADLARRLDVKPDEIAVVKVESVTWPDASLGCPQPGMGYAQVLTPGYLVILEAGGELHEYHTDVGSTILLCEEADTGQTPAKEPDTTVQDGWPSQPREDDVIIVPPLKWKRP